MTAKRTDSNGRVPRPPVQRISDGRVQMIKAIALASAVALVAFDAKISYDGFRMLALPQYVPLVLAALIFTIQLASGAVQQLGMDPFKGVGGSTAMDFVWRWVLISVYVIDIGSNAIAFGVGQYLPGFWGMLRDPFSLSMPIILILLSLLLTFGDEILLRLVDRLDIGSRANRMSARKASIEAKAYEKYLNNYDKRAIQYADQAGQRSVVEFDWVQASPND